MAAVNGKDTLVIVCAGAYFGDRHHHPRKPADVRTDLDRQSMKESTSHVLFEARNLDTLWRSVG